jgi:serine/threonine-protein kinase RsbW
MTDPAGDVVLSLPPRSSHLRIARLTASSFAADLGFGLDDTEDLRVAVTELCSVLLQGEHGGDGGGPRIELHYRVDGDRVVIEGRRPGMDGAVPELDPIARELLAVTTDTHTLEAQDDNWIFTVRKGASDPA